MKGGISVVTAMNLIKNVTQQRNLELVEQYVESGVDVNSTDDVRLMLLIIILNFNWDVFIFQRFMVYN